MQLSCPLMCKKASCLIVIVIVIVTVIVIVMVIVIIHNLFTSKLNQYYDSSTLDYMSNYNNNKDN